MAALLISDQARDVFRMAGVGPEIMPTPEATTIAAWALTNPHDIPPHVEAALGWSGPGTVTYAVALFWRLEDLQVPAWCVADVRRHIAGQVGKWTPDVLRWCATQLERHGPGALDDVHAELAPVWSVLAAIAEREREVAA